jgi:hypothetical protein
MTDSTWPTPCDLAALARRCPDLLAHCSVLPHCNVLQGVSPPRPQEAPHDCCQHFHGHGVCAGNCWLHFLHCEQRITLQAIWGHRSRPRTLIQCVTWPHQCVTWPHQCVTWPHQCVTRPHQCVMWPHQCVTWLHQCVTWPLGADPIWQWVTWLWLLSWLVCTHVTGLDVCQCHGLVFTSQAVTCASH